jgi:nitrate reductase gamma subunit
VGGSPRAATNEGDTVTALGWQISVLGVLGVSLVVVAVRTLAIARQPIHLRWELAPVPQSGKKGGYGGSYLEEYEWWSRPRPHSRTAALIYTAKEMLLLRSVWKHNRGLWPLTFALHYGLYLLVGLSLGMAVVAVLSIAGLEALAAPLLRRSLSALVLLGYLLGSAGAIGLLLKRAFDPDLRPFSTHSRYFNLLFLGTVFLSGCYAWLRSGDYVAEVSRFAHGLIALEANATVAFPLSFHLAVSLLFLLYLPVTDMIHFIAKYFTYHAVQWDDRPQNGSMERELRGLLRQPVTWSASHVGSDGRKDWADVAVAEAGDEPKP